MKKIITLLFIFFSIHCFAVEINSINSIEIEEIKIPEMTDEEWFDSLEEHLTVEDKNLIKKYEQFKYSKHERMLALFTQTSSFIQQKSIERFLFPDIDKEIDKVNSMKRELKSLSLDGNPYSFELSRIGNKIYGNFSIELNDKDSLEKLKKDKYSLYNFSKDFISYYFCTSEMFNLWLVLDYDIFIKYNISKNKKTKIVTYNLQPQLNHCKNYQDQ